MNKKKHPGKRTKTPGTIGKMSQLAGIFTLFAPHIPKETRDETVILFIYDKKTSGQEDL